MSQYDPIANTITLQVQFLEDELLLKIRATYDLALLSEAYQLYLPFRESSPKRAQIIDALNLSINEKLDNSVASLSDLIRLVCILPYATRIHPS